MSISQYAVFRRMYAVKKLHIFLKNFEKTLAKVQIIWYYDYNKNKCS